MGTIGLKQIEGNGMTSRPMELGEMMSTEVREVLLRACTGMANGPAIMAAYDREAKAIEAAQAWRAKWDKNDVQTDDELAIVDALDALREGE